MFQISHQADSKSVLTSAKREFPIMIIEIHHFTGYDGYHWVSLMRAPWSFCSPISWGSTSHKFLAFKHMSSPSMTKVKETPQRRYTQTVLLSSQHKTYTIKKNTQTPKHLQYLYRTLNWLGWPAANTLDQLWKKTVTRWWWNHTSVKSSPFKGVLFKHVAMGPAVWMDL